MYQKTAYEVIKRALNVSGILGVEQPVQRIDMATGVETLNYLLQGWMSEGLRLWTEKNGVLFLEKGRRTYELGETGSKSTYLESLTVTSTSQAESIGSSSITLQSVSGISAPQNFLTVDPSVTITGWEAENSAVLALSGGFLEVENGAASNGSAKYSIDTELGKNYRFTYGYLQGTSASADFSVLDADGNQLATANQTATGVYTLDFTATENSHFFEIANGSAVIGENSQLNSLEALDLDSGDFISVKLDDLSRFWTTVESISGLVVTLRDPVTDSLSLGSRAYSYPQADQLKRPLNIDDIRYQQDFTYNELPVTKQNRNEDRMQPLKTSQGTVTWAYYSPQLSRGVLDTWQVPSDSNGLLQFTSIDPVLITIENVETVEIPAYYLNAVVWNLANEFVAEYNVTGERAARIQQKAAYELEKATDYDEEKTDLQVRPSHA